MLTTLVLEHGQLLDDRRDNWSDVVFITAHPYRWPERAIERVREDVDFVFAVIERRHSGLPTASKNLEKAKAALERNLEHVQHLYSATEATIVIPDTNALYWNPALEQWRHLTTDHSM